MLSVEGLRAGYGGAPALWDASLSVGAGEVLALLGRNGMGKTTAVRALMGLIPVEGGRVRVDGRDVAGWPPHRIARLGLGLVPEGRQVFPTLSVRENLVATAADRGAAASRGAAANRDGAAPWTLERVYALFPRLRERARHAGRALSGGEQQMLAIGRALMTNPRLLILDEATEGLAPLVREEIWSVLGRLKAEGQSILLIDKHLGPVLRLADRATVLERGRTVWSGTGAALAASPAVRDAFLHA